MKQAKEGVESGLEPAARGDGAVSAPVAGGSLRRELLRKRLHISTAIVPVLVWTLPQEASLAMLGGATALALLIEWARVRVDWVRYWFFRITRVMLRRHERDRISGATYMVVAYLLAFLLFPLPVAVAAMLYNAFGDAAAAVAGRRWGRYRTAWGKSWEGAAAGAAVNVGVGLVVPGIGVGAAVVGGVVAAAVEFLPLPLDDNLRVTLIGGLALWVATGIG